MNEPNTEESIRILIVEDEALIAEGIRLQLEYFGYNICEVCYSFDTALEQIHNSNFDILLSDINLGNGTAEKSGLQLVEELKTIRPCPFIFLTALNDMDTIKKAAMLSPSAYLIKPIHNFELYAAIQVAVENFKTNYSPGIEHIKNVKSPDFFYIKHGQSFIKLFWKDVTLMEAVKNYVKIKTKDHQSGLLQRGSLQSIMQNIPIELRDNFLKLGRSVVIAKDQT